jgi:hypothetical protein
MLRRLTATTDAARVAAALCLMPPAVRDMLRDRVDTELAVIRLRMTIGDPQAVAASIAAAYEDAERTGKPLGRALDDERRHVTTHGPRYLDDELERTP